MNYQDLFNLKNGTPSDIGEHLNRMREIAQGSKCIVEFGVRAGCSTSAWIAARPEKLFSYDFRIPEELDIFKAAAKSAGVDFTFTQADTGLLEWIPGCDILFLDTLHTGPHLLKELRHHKSASRHIILHDTETFASVGEFGQPGLDWATRIFLKDNPEWSISEHHINCNGLTVLSRK